MTRYIDADALSNVMADRLALVSVKCGMDSARAMEAAKAMAIVNAQPTIDAEPVRHGMFIGTEYDGYADGNPVYYEWKCSECGCVFEEEEPTYRYCPNCGADMRGTERREE